MATEGGDILTGNEKEIGPFSSVRYAYERLSMSDQDRRKLASNLGIGEFGSLAKEARVSDGEAAQIFATAKVRTEEKLALLGIEGLVEYNQLYDAFAGIREGNPDNHIHLATIQTICKLAVERRYKKMNNLRTTKEMHTKPNGDYTSYWNTQHDDIVARALKDTLEHKPKEGDKPTLLILGGPPGGGKSSARKLMLESAAVGEQFVIADPDAQRLYLLDNYDPTDQLQTLQTQAEAFDVSDLILEAAKKGMRDVVIEGAMRNGPWLEEKIREFEAEGYRVEIAWVHKDPEGCLVSATAFRDRGVDPELILTCLMYGYANFRYLSAMPQVGRASIFQRTTDDIEVVSEIVAGENITHDESAKNALEARISPFEQAVPL